MSFLVECGFQDEANKRQTPHEKDARRGLHQAEQMHQNFQNYLGLHTWPLAQWALNDHQAEVHSQIDRLVELLEQHARRSAEWELDLHHMLRMQADLVQDMKHAVLRVRQTGNLAVLEQHMWQLADLEQHMANRPDLEHHMAHLAVLDT